MRKATILAIGMVVLFAGLTISTASASEYYLSPDNSSAPSGDTVEVQLRINATQAIQGGKVTILHNPSVCANITGITFDPEWESKTRAIYPDRFVVTFYNKDEYDIPTNLSAGDYLIGTLTIKCDSTSECTTDLMFNTADYKTDLWAVGIPHVPFTVDHGTFTCITAEPPTLVTYTITNTTITPPQTTSIDVEFSEQVSAIIKIEDTSGNIVNELYNSSGVTNPNPCQWGGAHTPTVRPCQTAHTL